MMVSLFGIQIQHAILLMGILAISPSCQSDVHGQVDQDRTHPTATQDVRSLPDQSAKPISDAVKRIVELNQALYDALEGAPRQEHVLGMAKSRYGSVRALAARLQGNLLRTASEDEHVKAFAKRHFAALVAACGDDVPGVRAAAAGALGRGGQEQALPSLTAMLADPETEARAAAAAAIGQIRFTDEAARRQAGSKLLDLLANEKPEVVAGACRSLGLLKDPRAVLPLGTLLASNRPPAVRREAAQALDGLADARVSDALVGALDDPLVPVRFHAVGAIRHLIAHTPLDRPQRRRLLDRLTQTLAHEADTSVRARAADALGEVGNGEVLDALWARVLSGDDAQVAAKAREAMLEIFKRVDDWAALERWNDRIKAADRPKLRIAMWDVVRARQTPAADVTTKPEGWFRANRQLLAACLDAGQWKPSVPLVRELLAHAADGKPGAECLERLTKTVRLASADGHAVEALRLMDEHQALVEQSEATALKAEWKTLREAVTAAEQEQAKQLLTTIQAHIEKLLSDDEAEQDAARQSLKPHWAQVKDLLLGQLADPKPEVRTAANRALERLLEKPTGFDPAAPDADRAAPLQKLRESLP